MDVLDREKVFRDPIYGYIHVGYDIIKDLIDTPAFQRLRRIKQLSGVQMVFHGAEHSRFSHSLGVYEVANRFLEIPDIKHTLSEREQLLFLTAALLHDIGHGAYSHAFEDVFLVNHEKIGASIIVENKEIREILNRVDDDFAKDVASIILKKGKFKIIEQLISSQLDVDRMDYLSRDAYFTGAAYGKIDVDRLTRVLRIKDGRVVFKLSGIHAIENYLISRYHMYWQVYFHPVARSYEVILEKIYLRIRNLLNENYAFNSYVEPLRRLIKDPTDLEAYLEIDDFYINGLIKSFLKTEDSILRILADDFMNRHIWEYINETNEHKDEINHIKQTMSDEELKYFTSSRTVHESTYKDETSNLGENIYILLENDEISTLKQQSKIIESLSYSGMKSDPKFFYRKKWNKFLLLKVSMMWTA